MAVTLNEIAMFTILTAYVFSFVILGVQDTVGDIVGVDMKAFDVATGGFTGETLKNEIQTMTDTFAGCYDNQNPPVLLGGFASPTYPDEATCTAAGYTWTVGTGSSFSQMSAQTAQMQLTMADEPSITNNPLTSGATMIFQLFQIVTGTYAFNILIFMGIPHIFVVGITAVYVILLAIYVFEKLRP
jgi:hypothetical protein